MMIVDYLEKVKSWCLNNKSDLLVAGLIFLTGLGSFGLGRLSVVWPRKEPIRVFETKKRTFNGKEVGPPAGSLTSLNAAVAGGGDRKKFATSALGQYVASKSGKFYHYPWCPGALRIKEQNKVWFSTREAAEAKGYKPATNCQGL